MDENRRHLYPLLFKPILKDYVWGGRNLERILGRELPDGRVAESWEIAAHKDGTSIVANGPYAGLPLTAVHELLGLDLIGRNNDWAQERSKFPLLVKLLDAQDKLSVQVHPDDAYALAHEGNELGKTEMWVVLHAEPQAQLIVGLRAGTTPESFRAAIDAGTLGDSLHTLSVKAGDFVCVPSGTVHAILGGLLIAEIQQNSNTTYRIYDWDRVENNRSRPLHIAEAMNVIDFGVIEPRICPPELILDSECLRRQLLCRNRYFTTERIEMAEGSEFSVDLDGQSLEIWGVLDGQIEVNGTIVRAAEFALLPAALGSLRAATAAGATCLRVYVEEP